MCVCVSVNGYVWWTVDTLYAVQTDEFEFDWYNNNKLLEEIAEFFFYNEQIYLFTHENYLVSCSLVVVTTSFTCILRICLLRNLHYFSSNSILNCFDCDN